MSEASRAYKVALWISEKGLADIEVLNEGFTAFMRLILSAIEPDRLAHDVAIGDQWEDLIELELLKSTVQVKEIAELEGGFDETHGPALELAANALYDHCGWDDEDITEWFGSLVLGAGVSVEFDEDGEE